jgi:beta-mannosidase
LSAPGWRLASCPAGAITTPAELEDLHWIDAQVPGTVAGALLAAGAWSPGTPLDVDGRDWWYRARMDAPAAAADEELVLLLDGIATAAEVFVDGDRVVQSDSMWEAHAIDVSDRPGGVGEIAIRVLALEPLLRGRRRPRARWRPRVADGGLRFQRTSLMGRAPGFAPGPPPAGPWRAVRLERRRGVVVDRLRVRPRLEGDAGVLDVRVDMRDTSRAPVAPAEVVLDGPSGRFAAALAPDGTATLRAPAVARWWPHTHGEPVLHTLTVRAAGEEVTRRRVGFRALDWRPRPEEDGLALTINGVDVFARGAVWTTADPVSLGSSPELLRPVLEAARDAGLNMIRLAGIGLYESAAFHDLCDELGLLVWQDFMFANFDYPVADAGFRATVEREAAQVLDTVAGRPSLAVLCGNSEVEQQVAMLGLDPGLARGELFDELLPAAARAAGTDVPYLPSAPCGGDLPISTDRGVANYFGVGGYRRPLDDARRAGVRFASECLAFANVGEQAGVEGRWKAGVARDVGSGWDFDDVRDHYLRLLYSVDPIELRATDPVRYLELSRSVSGEVMAEVFGEWRRTGSPCAGGIVLWLRDLQAGAGWGVLDHHGRPKVAYHHLRRALAPVALWSVDEGLGGIRLHVANDGPAALRARLRVALYRGGEQLVEEANREIEVPPHGAVEHGAEELIGRFVDVSYAYRFGPPGHDAVVATLHRGDTLLAQTVRFPTGRPAQPEPAARIGLEAVAAPAADGSTAVTLRTRRLAWGVRLRSSGWTADDDAIFVEPSLPRRLRLDPRAGHPTDPITFTALNVEGSIAPRTSS